MNHEKIQYVDDDYESIGTLFTLRIPTLIVGLILGIGISFVMSGFEEVLTRQVEIAFFLPFVIYIAAAIGTQTEAIYSRDLKTGRAKFHTYLRKEFALGIIFGMLFGAFSGVVAWLWLEQTQVAMSVAAATTLAIVTAPVIALLVTQALQTVRKDPAAGAGPIATVIQDITSILIYGIVSSLIIL